MASEHTVHTAHVIKDDAQGARGSNSQSSSSRSSFALCPVTGFSLLVPENSQLRNLISISQAQAPADVDAAAAASAASACSGHVKFRSAERTVFRSSFTARRLSTLARSVRVRLGFGSFFLDADVGQLACCTGRSLPCCSCCCFCFLVTTRVSKTWRSRATERQCRRNGGGSRIGGRQVGNAICRLSTAEASTGGG